MESLEQLHRQLDSVQQLRTIVKTMKALSATSIRQYEQAVAALALYYRTVERGLHVVLKDTEPPAPPAPANQPRRLAAIVFGSDHGLCGRFNEDITEYARKRMASAAADPQHRLLLSVGARVAASLEQAGEVVAQDLLVPGSADQITATVQRILLTIDDWRKEARVHYVYLFYNRHSGGGRTYQPTGIELLPLNLHRFHRLQEERWPSRLLPIFTMDRGALLSRLIHQYLFVSVFRACAESQASEHTSRLSAMQAAERNLDERLEEVTGAFRRARQTAITSELLDVVAGFEAIATRGG
ncbi:MAG: F0F1 ATP synthase subunit gamma [Thiocapsa sp.]|nr:F0F1 ATP synthase subunit gamma [Thiocapsa sp.]MCG6985272.1 F0F1 ATP synthase subunit gamma [Thiocapsa sp.]